VYCLPFPAQREAGWFFHPDAVDVSLMAAQKKRQPGRRVQLHRALSKLGWGSRAQAWDWICAGEVRVDGKVVTDPLTWVDLDHQRITRAGGESVPAPPLTVALHKPAGIVTTRRDERGRRTVYDLLPDGLPWIFPVGRLDANSEGLLILTNDEQLAVRLTEPAHRVPRTYRVQVRGSPTPEVLEQLRRGIMLKDGRTRPAQVRILRCSAAGTELEVVLTEGRNRQLRRMLAAVGHRVRRLVRVAIGGLPLADLPRGEWRVLREEEVHQLLAPRPPEC
jgi:23S rRNA pseudouridine2605 synthase